MKRILAVQEIIQIIEKWDHMKLRCLCTAKEVVSRVKTASSERGVCASYVPDSGCRARMHKEKSSAKIPGHLNSKCNNVSRQVVKNTNGQDMDEENVSILVIREMQIETALTLSQPYQEDKQQ